MLKNNSADLTIGFDVGGTNVRGGVITREGEILASRTVPTSMDAEQLETDIVGIVEELRAEYAVDAVGLALAGFLDPSCQVVRFAPHLPWRQAHVQESLSRKLDMHVRLEHDANSAAWGEWRFGAGRGAEDWVFFAVGTGIGATLMTHDTIYRGAFGTAPEFGHIVVSPNGRQCSCGKRGCLERYASGTALPDTCADLREHYETSLPTEPTGKEITQAARRGDPLAVAVMEDFSRWLGQGLSIVADVLDPELIVLGGGVSQDADLYLEGATKAMGQDIVGAGHRPLARVATAELGSAAGMIGVADLARSGR
ncbi:ROK family protein [Corynebacterium kefirresidentii]|uniref:ROK family protein n=1 Tax=Corynebacterium kefirresidentii TaxID=1979527 RepID=UPI000A371A75|nr:ROK family protein [Corynebacterium kefirresidentii]OUJ24496.1 glucokinase [Corynebacterium kefirresidentii]